MEIAQYLKSIPDHRKAKFDSLRILIKSLYPKASETMQYKMPTYSNGNGWVALANQKNYISLYTCSAEHIETFKTKHPKIKTGKGCINFRDKDELPVDDLRTVITSAMELVKGQK